MNEQSWTQKFKNIVFGKSLKLGDKAIFHKLSLVAFFAWVGLGADGLSSSCYGPEEAFRALQAHPYLSVFIALASVLTVLIISASYSQIIELFPSGGGGYLVASKLLSPTLGVVSGCALLVDYVLTITISLASGADALFSLLPVHWHPYKFAFQIAAVVLLTLMNVRGVREAVLPWVPIFLLFVVTHVFVIAYTVISHVSGFSEIFQVAGTDLKRTQSELGLWGMLFLLLKAYSMGAGTYTGIEAVSNGLPILREPKVLTGKKTMRYMAFSLAITVAGLLVGYLLFKVQPQDGKTLNAVLFESVTKNWSGNSGFWFVMAALISEAALLCIAAQAGFLDGPRVMANMAVDRWLPTKFATLSDRFVTRNGILLMGIGALLVMVYSHGSVALLVVLYSINVFITFSLSQLGMVRHWWKNRSETGGWKSKFCINGIGFILTSFILISLSIIKFQEGGWITLLVTAVFVGLAMLIKRHYEQTRKDLKRLDDLVVAADCAEIEKLIKPEQKFDPQAKTAVILVNGFNGIGLHTLLTVIQQFGESFKNFAFVQIGVVDAGNFKGAEEVQNLQNKVKEELNRYTEFLRRGGRHAESFFAMGTDVAHEVVQLAPKILERFPKATFFGGKLVFKNETYLSRLLHNYVIFAIQRRFYAQGTTFIILPIRV